MNKFLSISTIVAVAMPIILLSTPAQALTWDDLWGAVKKGVVNGIQMGTESAIQKNMAEQSNDSQDSSEQPTAEQSNSEPAFEEVSE